MKINYCIFESKTPKDRYISPSISILVLKNQYGLISNFNIKFLILKLINLLMAFNSKLNI